MYNQIRMRRRMAPWCACETAAEKGSEASVKRFFLLRLELSQALDVRIRSCDRSLRCLLCAYGEKRVHLKRP